MIKNEKQYKVTMAQANLLMKAIEELDSEAIDTQAILFRAQKESLLSQYDELIEEVEEYDALKSGKVDVLEIATFADLPKGLIKARIASSMSQKDLANRLSIKEQQIQRYEATEYASASFERMMEIVEILGLSIAQKIHLPENVISMSRLFANLKNVGLEKSFIVNRILPERVAQNLELNPSDQQVTSRNVREAASIVSRVFGLKEHDLFAVNPTQLQLSQIPTRYKKATNVNQEKLNAYTLYAHVVALNVLECTAHLTRKIIPSSAKEVREIIAREYGAISFKNVLRYVWDLGIPVVPFSESINFNGACWRVEGKNVIALKQKTSAAIKWIFDLLHELRHASQHPEQLTFVILEPEKYHKGMEGEIDETDANDFAAEVLLGENADDMAYECIVRSNRNLPQLKSAVMDVAYENNVDVGALANHIAFRLSVEQNKNWWGTASNLQKMNTESFDVARDVLYEKVQFENLNEFDRELIVNALK